MAKADRDRTTLRPEITTQVEFPDGRVKTLITWPDGEWKVEIFPSADHATKFAKDNDMDMYDAYDNK